MSSPSVLVVDDDPLMRLIIYRNLAAYFPTVLVRAAGTVAEVQQHLQGGAPTLVVTDYHLPDGTGQDVLAVVRAHGTQLPVVALSADDRVGAAMLRAGAVAFVAKPFDRTAFLAVVARSLRR